MSRQRDVRLLSGWSLRFGLAAVCLSLLLSGESLQKTRAQSAKELTVKQVLDNVRKAVGYAKLKSLKRGFIIQESYAESGDDGAAMWFGTNGEYRQGTKSADDRPLGYDGKFGWQVDRTGVAAPLSQRLREKLLIPAWVRGGWWLNERAPFVYSLLPAETNDKQVALNMKLEGGLVGAKVVVDRATWLPSTLVVEYERGPYTMTLKDYQEPLGFRLPQRTSVNYRGKDTEYKVKSVAEIAKDANAPFAVPPLPADTSFDNSVPAELKVAQGVPFSDGAQGHFYVRASVDGRDVGWFHFDTGSDSMQIDTKLADELKLPIIGRSQTRGADGKPQEVTIRQGKTFQLGRVTYRNPIFLATDMTGRNAPPGEKRAGYVGYPLMARVVAEVTGGGKSIALYDPKSYKLSGGGKWQELSFIDVTPAVNCRFEGNREGLFQLDTGTAGTVTFYEKYLKDQKLLEGRKVKEETNLGAGGAYQELMGTIEWFELAGYRFKNPEAGFRVAGLSREGGAGVVGREFLSVFKIVFDYPDRRVAFVR
ncbi:MAG: hypothetical protein QOD00_277 [Blastocatellia bacterium]|nr:hypothetical protein [Blastocatellia bacterium]